MFLITAKTWYNVQCIKCIECILGVQCRKSCTRKLPNNKFVNAFLSSSFPLEVTNHLAEIRNIPSDALIKNDTFMRNDCRCKCAHFFIDGPDISNCAKYHLRDQKMKTFLIRKLDVMMLLLIIEKK